VKVRVLLAVGWSVIFLNPRSCRTGVEDAIEELLGSPMYSWATSAPATLPLFVSVMLTLAILSYKPAVPPGAEAVEPADVESTDVVKPLYANVV
jgi:hypothetical protein